MQLRDVVSAEVLDPLTIRYTFTGSSTRNLPATVGGLPILSKAYYAARNFEETSLEAPLGSGVYKIADYKQGTYVSYKRREDYWGRDLPVMTGRYNFDEIRYDYFRERLLGLQALKAGVLDLRERTFTLPLSPMVHSPAFEALPAALRERVVERLHTALSRGRLPGGVRMTVEQRFSLRDHLTALLPGYAAR